jgi:hypothetical protein
LFGVLYVVKLIEKIECRLIAEAEGFFRNFRMA